MTVGALIDKTFRTYLEPPDAQPAATRLVGSMSSSTDTFAVDTFEVPEDLNLVRIGSVVEVNRELMRVLSWDDAAGEGTVERGVDGTVAAAHADADRLKLAPRFPRQSVFDAVRDNIISLYPRLWTVRTDVIAPAGDDVYPLTDPLAVAVVEANPYSTVTGTLDVDGRIVDNHPVTGTRSFVTKHRTQGELWLRFRRRMGVATDETDTLETLGVETVWETLVCVGAAADLLSGRDIPKAHTDWVGSVLEAENIPVRTKQALSVGLVQYRNLLIDGFSKEMKGEESNGVRVQMNNPFTQVG